MITIAFNDRKNSFEFRHYELEVGSLGWIRIETVVDQLQNCSPKGIAAAAWCIIELSSLDNWSVEFSNKWIHFAPALGLSMEGYAADTNQLDS